jgi:hypothetical protein
MRGGCIRVAPYNDRLAVISTVLSAPVRRDGERCRQHAGTHVRALAKIEVERGASTYCRWRSELRSCAGQPTSRDGLMNELLLSALRRGAHHLLDNCLQTQKIKEVRVRGTRAAMRRY